MNRDDLARSCAASERESLRILIATIPRIRAALRTWLFETARRLLIDRPFVDTLQTFRRAWPPVLRVVELYNVNRLLRSGWFSSVAAQDARS